MESGALSASDKGGVIFSAGGCTHNYDAVTVTPDN